MRARTRLMMILAFILLASLNAAAQSDRVSFKPIFKPGQETRYLVNASVETRVTPANTNGIATSIRRETTATVLFRAVASEKGDPTTEAVIEAIETRTAIDGVDRPATGTSLAGVKLQYQLDSLGRLAKASFPKTIVETGLPELIFSMTRWAPAGEVAVGQTWGQGSANESLVGDYGYISTNTISDIVKGATISYKLSKVERGKAVVEGAIVLNQSGDSMLTTREGPVNVSVIASGNGNARVEYDVAGSRIIAASTETSLEGRLTNVPPGPKSEKRQPREGSVVETAKFSIKLVP